MKKESASQIEIRKAGNDEFYFAFRLPGNGIFVSIFFDRVSEAIEAVEYVQRNSTGDTNYHCAETSTNEVAFVLKTNGNKPIGRSTTYNSKSSMVAAMQYIQRHFQNAKIIDLTA